MEALNEHPFINSSGVARKWLGWLAGKTVTPETGFHIQSPVCGLGNKSSLVKVREIWWLWFNTESSLSPQNHNVYVSSQWAMVCLTQAVQNIRSLSDYLHVERMLKWYPVLLKGDTLAFA